MTDITLTYEVSEDVQEMLANLQRALEPSVLGEFLSDEVVPFLQDRARARFAGEGDEVVGRWRNLAATTQRIREAAGFSAAHPINKRTGDLEAYITGSGATSIQGAGSASIIYPGRGEADSVMEQKVETAQKGRAKPTTPPRPVLGVGDSDMRWVLARLQNSIEMTLA